VDQPLPLPVGVSDLAVGSEPELVWLLAASLLMALVAILRWRFLSKRNASQVTLI